MAAKEVVDCGNLFLPLAGSGLSVSGPSEGKGFIAAEEAVDCENLFLSRGGSGLSVNGWSKGKGPWLLKRQWIMRIFSCAGVAVGYL